MQREQKRVWYFIFFWWVAGREHIRNSAVNPQSNKFFSPPTSHVTRWIADVCGMVQIITPRNCIIVMVCKLGR